MPVAAVCGKTASMLLLQQIKERMKNMFCSKCGSQLPDGSTFCSVCGAQQGAPAAQPAANPYAAPNAYGNPAPYGYAAPSKAGALKFRAPDFKDKKVLFFIIAAGLVLLAMIFSLTNVVKVSALGMSQGASLGASGRGAAVAFVIIFSLIAIAACALVALFDMPEMISKICKIAAPAAAILACLIFLIGYWSAKGEAQAALGGASSYGYDFGSLVSIGLSFAGWMAVIFFLGAAGLTGYNFFKENKKAAPAAPTYTPPYNPYG